MIADFSFVVVDSLKPTELIVSFTSFSHWLETQTPPATAQAPPVGSVSNPSNAGATRGKETKTPDRPPGTADGSDQVSVIAGEGETEGRKGREALGIGKVKGVGVLWGGGDGLKSRMV